MMPSLLGFGLFTLLGVSRANWIQQEPGVLPYSAVRSSWVLNDKVPAEHSVELTVALRVDSDRHAALEKFFWADPLGFHQSSYPFAQFVYPQKVQLMVTWLTIVRPSNWGTVLLFITLADR